MAVLKSASQGSMLEPETHPYWPKEISLASLSALRFARPDLPDLDTFPAQFLFENLAPPFVILAANSLLEPKVNDQFEIWEQAGLVFRIRQSTERIRGELVLAISSTQGGRLARALEFCKAPIETY